MKILLSILAVSFVFVGYSNKRASELYLDLQKLHSLKRVLYIAAHPDDENTRALAWFSLSEKAETAYMSLTRGDGGQNLIGNELSEYLGVLRTQELLSARSFDGAKQYFSRAVDFGYSKSAKESLSKWGREAILSDVVLVIRQFRPDVIITRFPPDKRGGHGHHTASAMLAIEAFEKAADPNFLPKQVEKHGVWQATSIYWNSSIWWNKDIADSAKNNSDYLIADIGTYNPLLGMSYNEIGTLARSEHKCQGFGAVVERGSRIEYFEHLGGDKLKTSFFEKNNTTWSELIDSQFEKEIDALLENFNFVQPENNIEALISIRKKIAKVEQTALIKEKLKLCDDLIINCSGLYIEVVGEDYSYTSGDTVKLKVKAVNRSNTKISLDQLAINGVVVSKLDKTLLINEKVNIESSCKPNTILGGPYWLRNDFTDIFKLTDNNDLGKAEGLPSLTASIKLSVNDLKLELNMPVEHVWREPSYGEKRRDMVCVPEVSATFDQKITIVKPNENKKIRVKIHAFKSGLQENISVMAPKGWDVKPKSVSLNLENKHDEQWLEFVLTPSKDAENGELTLVNSAGKLLYSYKEIAYNHIPTQTIINKTKLKCIKLDAEIIEGEIAYINGVQDAVPAAIKELGFNVKQYEVEDLAMLDLSQFQSIVLGIRIYNVHPELANYHDKLYKYVEEGGNLVMQYNTASRAIRDKEFGPTSFKLSRNRVTEEDATVEFLNPNHTIMKSPNKITKTDFDDWVQERGLYFADNWSSEYEALLSWHDVDENAQKGALIVAPYGKGQFVYTGISFFRELPNGVVGAYRLFANILSYQP